MAICLLMMGCASQESSHEDADEASARQREAALLLDLGCVDNTDCGNDSACSVGLCVAGLCVQGQLPGCCEQDGDCDQDLVCGVMACIANECVEAETSGCNPVDDSSTDESDDSGGLLDLLCLSDSECDDGDPCTDDVCLLTSGICVSASNPLCCQNDTDCSGLLECGASECVDNRCALTPLDQCSVDDEASDAGGPSQEDAAVVDAALGDAGDEATASEDSGPSIDDVLTADDETGDESQGDDVMPEATDDTSALDDSSGGVDASGSDDDTEPGDDQARPLTDDESEVRDDSFADESADDDQADESVNSSDDAPEGNPRSDDAPQPSSSSSDDGRSATDERDDDNPRDDDSANTAETEQDAGATCSDGLPCHVGSVTSELTGGACSMDDRPLRSGTALWLVALGFAVLALRRWKWVA